MSRDHLNVVFIGHVDAGKSTIGGQILYLTGGVDERTIQKYERCAGCFEHDGVRQQRRGAACNPLRISAHVLAW